jgi:hypothetical protein
LKNANGESFLLHPGESASGMTLRDFDAEAGWVVLDRGSNQVRLHLINRVASAPFAPGPVPVTASSFSQQAGRVSNTNTEIGQNFMHRPSALETGENLPLGRQPPAANPSATGFVRSLPSSIENPATPVDSAPLDSAPPSYPDSSPGAAVQNNVAAALTSPTQNAFWREGERIRALYGDAGLFAWQQDQHLKSLSQR